MTQDQIIEIARQAGFTVGYGSPALSKHEAFAKLVVASIDPSKFMSYHEGYQAGLDTATQGFLERLRQLHDSYSCASDPSTIRARGERQ